MQEEIESTALRNTALEKITYGEDLLQSLVKYQKLDGIQKLERKIRQEINFLKKICKSNTIKKEHLQCSNLTHFSALVEVLSQVENCTHVNKPFMLDDRKIIIDIISDGGLTWTKVIARNPKSLSQICLGNTNYGVRSIFDQAEEYIECAQQYPCMFQTPKLIFVFANGIGTNLALKLESLNIKVEGERLNIDNTLEFEFELPELTKELSTENTAHIPRVNVDVSTMLAYVSSVTNGSCLKYKFDVPVLAQQAEWEVTRPVKPLLDNFFKDKTLYCCETAKESFLSILYIVGGEKERLRGEELLKRIIVLKDDASYEDIVTNNVDYAFNSVQYSGEKILPIGGKIKERSLTIFTFGDRIHAVTVSSNDGFVRAAKQQGINFVVFVHESRALTEQKERDRKSVV